MVPFKALSSGPHWSWSWLYFLLSRPRTISRRTEHMPFPGFHYHWVRLSQFFRGFDKIPWQKQCKRKSVYFDYTSGFHSAIVGKKWAGAWGCWLHGIESRSKAKWIQAAAPSPLLQLYSPGLRPRNDSTHSRHIISSQLNVMKIIHRHVQRPS